jgi:hypothetical protein
MCGYSIMNSPTPERVHFAGSAAGLGASFGFGHIFRGRSLA